MNEFESEAALVERFLESLLGGDNPWAENLDVITEFYYLRGRTDIVAVTPEGEVVAFEAKLSRWKVALHQAYRNKCFAHRSYVLLPEAAATVAARRLSQFQLRGVGLCVLGFDGIAIFEEADHLQPIQPNLAAAAVAKATAKATAKVAAKGENG